MRLRDNTQSLRRREAARSLVVEPRAVPQAFAELSHDLRQPLTTIRMNLQSAMRLLEGPNPRVGDAVEALADCLLSEAEMVELLTEAQRRIAQVLNPGGTFSLNRVSHEVVLGLQTPVAQGDVVVLERLDSRAPVVLGSPWRLRMILVTIVRRLRGALPQESTGGRQLMIETRVVPPRAVLAITGMSSSVATAPAMLPLLEILEAAVQRIGGGTALDAESDDASLQIFLPLASGIINQGGPYGD